MPKSLLIVGLMCLLSLSAKAQEAPRAELFGGYSYLRAGEEGQSSSLHGWNASVAGGLNRWFGVVADFSGHYTSEGSVGIKIALSQHYFLFGPRLSYRRHEKLTPFAHILLGRVRAGAEADATPTSGAISASFTRFALALGGGIDVKVRNHVAVRLIQADYIRAHFAEAQNNARISVGLVLRPGGK